MRATPSTQSEAETGYARLNCRVSVRIKSQAEEAASLLGQSITDFTESALAEKAQTVFERQERLTLSERDFERFVSSLDHPEHPTARLRDAVSNYRKLKADHPESNL